MYIANDENKFEVDQIYTGRYKLSSLTQIKHTYSNYA